MRTWQNGERGKVVKEIIDGNFEELDVRMSGLESSNKAITKMFFPLDWENGIITIDYAEYKKVNPCIELYIKTDKGYSIVYGGYVLTDNGIELQSDIAYEGKVVIR